MKSSSEAVFDFLSEGAASGEGPSADDVDANDESADDEPVSDDEDDEGNGTAKILAEDTVPANHSSKQ